MLCLTRPTDPRWVAAALADLDAQHANALVVGYSASSTTSGADGVAPVLVDDGVLAALTARGEATAAELAGDDARLATELVLSAGKSYQGRQTIASRVLLLLAAQGRAVRGRSL